jgi:hypothetical protein
VFLDDPTLAQMLLQPASGVDQDFQSELQGFVATARDLLVRALENGQRLGIIAAGDPHLLACFTIGATKEVLLDSVSTKRTREEIVDALYSIMAAGFLRVGDRPVTAARKRRG